MIGSIVLISGVFAFGQGTAFTYQGRLSNAGNPANGNFDFTFSLFDTNASGNQISNTITNSATTVSNGLFNVALDFGAGVFAGNNLWLEIAVRPAGSNVAFSTLSPRQTILATPYSIYAQSAGGIIAGGIAGIPNMQVFTTSGIFTVPSGVNKIMVEVWAGGGGGGNANIFSVCSAGGGGGGGFGKDVFGVTPGNIFTVTVGTGGSAGQSGGSSSFGALISASGGSAGASVSQNSSAGDGGAGGTSLATFNSNGASGSGGAVGSSLHTGSLTGGQSIVAGGAGGAAGGLGGGGGGGGTARTQNSIGGNGGNGSSPGGGGGGAGEGGYGAGTGGVGGNGQVVVYW